MTRPEKISKMKGARNIKSGVRVKNRRARKQPFRMTGKQILLVGVMLLLLMGSGISHVWSSFEVTQKGYDISQLKNKEMKLMETNRKLRLELAILKSPHNLESLANKLGLKQPSPEQIIVLR